MLTVICPNCQHQFSTSGCCEVSSDASSEKRNTAEAEAAADETKSIHGTTIGSRKTTRGCYTGGLLVPHDYTNDDNLTDGAGDCYAPTIIQGFTVIQSGVHCGGSVVTIAGPAVTEFPYDVIRPSAAVAAAAAANNSNYYPRLNDSMSVIVKTKNAAEFGTKSVECVDESASLPSIKQQRVATTYELTGGNVMITTHTHRIQSGGCMIQYTDGEVLVQTPHIEIRSKDTGGGCLVQRQLSTEDEQLTNATNILNHAAEDSNDHQQMFVNSAPRSNGCAKMSGGTLLTLADKGDESATTSTRPKRCMDNCCNYSGRIHQQNLCQSRNELSNVVVTDNRSSTQIHVNVQLPANGGECRLNITTTQPDHAATTTTRPSSSQIASTESTRANCSARNSISTDDIDSTKNWSTLNGSNERTDGAPTTPVSWLMPYPWSVESGKFAEQAIRDPNRLREVKALLHMCGWYHEGISWQQSENLLKYTPIGCWLMRDSSDSRYTFAVSVQTTRGPTSIRIHQLFEGFRFDARPSMALPCFSCPIKLLEHYINYSKKMDEKRKEVWVDYSGQIYSQIYLAQPLLKEVRPLSHLARLVVNQHKLRTEHLPLVIRNYIAEYPYTL